MAKVVKKLPQPNETKILNSKDLGIWIKHARTKSKLTRQESADFCNWNDTENIDRYLIH